MHVLVPWPNFWHRKQLDRGIWRCTFTVYNCNSIVYLLRRNVLQFFMGNNLFVHTPVIIWHSSVCWWDREFICKVTSSIPNSLTPWEMDLYCIVQSNLVISPQSVQGHFLARGEFGEITSVQVYARKTGSSVKYDGENSPKYSRRLFMSGHCQGVSTTFNGTQWLDIVLGRILTVKRNTQQDVHSCCCISKAKKVKQMIYIAVLCNSRITAEPLYNTPLFIGPYAAANNMALLAWRPSQGTKLYCLVNRGTLVVNNLPRVLPE